MQGFEQAKINLALEPSIPKYELKVDELYSTYSYFYSPHFKYCGESHEAWELIFVSLGSVTVITPEYERVLNKNDIFIHAPNELHRINANNVTCNVSFISFKCGCERLYDIAKTVIAASDANKKCILRIIDEGLLWLSGKNYIPITNRKSQFGGGQAVKNMLEVLLIDLIRQSEEKDNENNDIAVSRQGRELVGFIVSYLNDNVCNKLKLEQIAHEIGYSVSHICNVFKSTTGMSIIHYYIRLKIGKAKQLIAKGDMSLRQISEYLDFDSVQYFSSQFKKVTNITPSQYAALTKERDWQIDDPPNIQFV